MGGIHERCQGLQDDTLFSTRHLRIVSVYECFAVERISNLKLGTNSLAQVRNRLSGPFSSLQQLSVITTDLLRRKQLIN